MRPEEPSARDERRAIEPTRIARGAAWATIEVWGVEVLQLLFFVVLARLVGPRGYGLVALAMAFVMIPQNLLVHGGWIEALVQRPILERAHIDSTFWLLAALGLASTLLLLALAPLIEAAAGVVGLAPLLSALAICPFLTSLMVVPAGLLQRRLALAPLALRSILGVSLGGIVAVGLALFGAGPWALVANEIAWPLVGAIVLGLAAGHRPGWRFSARHAREMGRFASRITGEQLVVLVEMFVPRWLLAGPAGTTAVGLWSLARKLLDLSVELVTRPALRVALPAFARHQDDRAQLARALVLAVELTALLAVPGYLLGLATAPDLSALIFGPGWREAGEALALLALLGPILPLTLLLTAGFQAVDRADLVFALAIAGVVSLVAMVVPLALYGGVRGVAWAFVLRGWLLLPIRLVLATRVLGVGFPALVRALAPPLAAGLVALAVLAGVRALQADPSRPAALALALGLAASAYAAALAALARPALRRVAAGLRRLRGGGDSTADGPEKPLRSRCSAAGAGNDPAPGRTAES